MGVLIRVMLMSEGDVLELGAGPGSTPLLHWLCKDMRRNLMSYENNPEFFNYARQFQTKLHRIRFVEDWNEIDSKIHRGVVFVSHAPWDRHSIEIIRFKDTADYIVIHGTNREEYYIDIWRHFRYIYTWKENSPWTSVVSNFKDLSELDNPLLLTKMLK